MQKLKINEIFKSIQGETTFAGLPFSFIRLSGCSLRCSYCDTSYAFEEGELLSINEILNKIDPNISHVMVTGGEPLDQGECKNLIYELIKRKYIVLVETSGCHSIAEYPREAIYIIDVKTPSSKMEKTRCSTILNEILPHDELKFVIGNRNDYEFSREIILNSQLWNRVKILVSCVYGRLQPKDLVQWILEDNLKVRFQLQLHKFIWPPDTRGV